MGDRRWHWCQTILGLRLMNYFGARRVQQVTLGMMGVVGLFLVVSLLPRPTWICGTRLSLAVSPAPQVPAMDPHGRSEFSVIELEKIASVRSMFPNYEQASAHKLGKNEDSDEPNKVKLFRLLNFDFSAFGRTWLNEIQIETPMERQLATKFDRIELLEQTNLTVSEVKPKGARTHLSQKQLNSQLLQHQSSLEQGQHEQTGQQRLRQLQTRHHHQLRQLQEEQLRNQPDLKLPECVRIKLPEGSRLTHICVHEPRVDNFISNRLRDTGQWEKEDVSRLYEFFKSNPDSQLVDLGCNVGVYSLLAASLGQPVLAVDILPANLALLQLSLATNDAIHQGLGYLKDRALLQYMLNHTGSRGDSTDTILGGSSPHAAWDSNINNSNSSSRRDDKGVSTDGRPRLGKYSELVTSLHNAVSSKRTKMYVYLKDDPNLGGTEVKEYLPEPNTPEEGHLPLTTSPLSQGQPVGRRKRSLLHRRRGKNRKLSKLSEKLHQSVRHHLGYRESFPSPSDPISMTSSQHRETTTDAQRDKKLHQSLSLSDLTKPRASSKRLDRDGQDRTVRPTTTADMETPAGGQQRGTADLTDMGKKILVDSICLDDIIPYLRPRRGVVVKMDVEGSEPQVLQCATRFFMMAEVKVVLMEFMFHKVSIRGKSMFQFLLRHNLVPVKDPASREPLDPGRMWEWPENVYFVRAR